MVDHQEADDLIVSGLSVYTDAVDGADRSRLEEVELKLSRGEWLNLVGVNGSGKSTLARVLAGLPEAGAVGSMRRGFAGEEPAAYVMQQPDTQLFGQTPREEMAFVLEWQGVPASELPQTAERMLARADLSAFADEPWARLSGGQRQLAVAAAAAGRSRLIVFDEATSMLDGAAAARVRAIARELHAAGTAVVWVTQRLEELEPERRVVAMADGRIAFDGSGREFIYGRHPLREEPPCLRCGLRLPYLASLALELYRSGHLDAPLPMNESEWSGIRGRAGTDEAI
ncbi:ATP-binding cassette domain-containing protein [Cohnella xylanilytica]|uniref:ATP-binding cassette domain-containing protein n=1 Tax=Cohnella xylanilytica TaxID=557555 RepID=A0A841TRC3_9BACL|nr:ATP-binding cassette domain-containing protein [Cohnella xylanilytica]MBB6690259.1 ATP-binding cassette domain-containing protein [Cohnella xylanilytica]